MSARLRLATWSGVAWLALMVAGCAQPDQPFAPSETADGPMLSGGDTPMFRITGGGRVDDPEALLKNAFYEPGQCDGPSFATFGFNAGPGRHGEPNGNLQWVDHCRGLRIHGYDVTSYETTSGSGRVRDRGCAVWEGPAKVNGERGYHFRIEPACDEGEPGRRDPDSATDTPDWIQIIVTADDGTVTYIRHGGLTGGNIQTHPVRR